MENTPTCQGPLPWQAALTGTYSGSSLALLCCTHGGHRAAKSDSLYWKQPSKGAKVVPVSPREVLFSVRVSLCAQDGVGGLCLAFLGSSSSPHMEQQRCEVWVERSGWRHKEEGKGEEMKGPLPLKCPTPARCGRGTACSRG